MWANVRFERAHTHTVLTDQKIWSKTGQSSTVNTSIKWRQNREKRSSLNLKVLAVLLFVCSVGTGRSLLRPEQVIHRLAAIKAQQSILIWISGHERRRQTSLHSLFFSSDTVRIAAGCLIKPCLGEMFGRGRFNYWQCGTSLKHDCQKWQVGLGANCPVFITRIRLNNRMRYVK